jgi:hypothetical protein
LDLGRLDKPTAQETVEQKTGICEGRSLHASCVDHTSMLLWSATGTQNAGCGDFKEFLSAVINWAVRKTIGRRPQSLGVAEKVRRVQTAKWNTNGLAARFICRNWDAISAGREEDTEEEPEQTHGPPGDVHAFDGKVGVIDLFITFTEAVERDAVTMGDARLELERLRHDWRRLAESGDPTAEECLEMIDQRFMTSRDALLMELAYVLTVGSAVRWRS